MRLTICTCNGQEECGAGYIQKITVMDIYILFLSILIWFIVCYSKIALSIRSLIVKLEESVETHAVVNDKYYQRNSMRMESICRSANILILIAMQHVH